MKNIPYIGSGAYCYANSTVMLLASIGEDISSSLIEVLSGVGLGAFIQKKSNLIFFSSLTGLPDTGISKALDILGFGYKEEAKAQSEPAPFEELGRVLKESPAILGPLDMGFLKYNPDCQHLYGVDHYVLAFSLEDGRVCLHDPAGFPCVFLSLNQLKKAWKADKVFYSKGFYRYWAFPKRIKTPTEKEIYKKALQFFKSIYQASEAKATKEKWVIGREAILTCAKRMQSGKASQDEVGQLIHFALPLGAKRALDFASFFDFRDGDLAVLKRQQAKLFGKSHTLAVGKDWPSLAKELQKLGDIEEKFRRILLGKD